MAELCLETTGQQLEFPEELDNPTGLEILELRILSAIEEKEFVNSCANHDIGRYGEWQCDYRKVMREINAEIESMISAANAKGEPPPSAKA